MQLTALEFVTSNASTAVATAVAITGSELFSLLDLDRVLNPHTHDR
jgi:hypothetical protein